MNLKNNTSKVKYTAISAAIGAALSTAIVVTPAVAVPTEYKFLVDTIQAVTITERQALNFGTALKLTPSAECVMTLASAVDYTGTDSFAVTAAGLTGIAASGTGCADTAAVNNAGHYLLTGAADTGVTVTLTSGGSTVDANASFTYEPSGFYDADSSGAGTGSIAKDAATNLTLDGSGAAIVQVGGKIKIGVAGLTAGLTDLEGNFFITVDYQ
jgi:hypothetical protein